MADWKWPTREENYNAISMYFNSFHRLSVMCSKMDHTMEEEILPSPSPVASPSSVASPDIVCTRCPVLEEKILFYLKKISWLRRSKSKLEDMSRKVN